MAYQPLLVVALLAQWVATGSAFNHYTLRPVLHATERTDSRASIQLAAKKRRKRSPAGGETPPSGAPPTSTSPSPPPPTAAGGTQAPPPSGAPGAADKPIALDGKEDDFGASSAALAAALEYGIPFPSEASSGAGDSSDDNALFELPDVSDLEKKRLSREAARNKKAEAEKSDKDESKRIARKDLKSLRARLELDPSADYDDSTFVKSYDTASALLAESAAPFLAIDAAYLQAGHLILLLSAVLCAFVEYPGNPLTEFPTEIRSFLKTGMALTLSINAVLAFLSVPIATEKKQPVPLWTGKALLLGGLAFDELNRAPDLNKKKNKNSIKR